MNTTVETKIAGVAIRNESGEYLLVQESKPNVYGLWNWPAGHVDKGETLQQAAIREAKEETGLEVKLTDFEPFYIASGDKGTDHRVYTFLAKVVSGELKFQADELLDARWFSADTIRQLDAEHRTRGSFVMAVVDKIESQ